MVETKDGKFYVLEVKASDELTDQDTQAKAKAAAAWCAAMSKTTKKSWEYKLIPHDAIQPEESFKAVLSDAVSIA